MNIYYLLAPLTIIGLSFYAITLYRKVLQNRDRYHTLFHDSPVPLITLNTHFQIVEWNESAHALFGWKTSDAIGRNIIDLIVPPKDQLHVSSVLYDALVSGKSTSKNANITASGEEILCEWRNSRIKTDHGGIICMANDITQISSYVDTLTYKACHDPLTGMTNRSTMDDRLRHAIDRAERFQTRVALFFIDLNDFKQINDSYGHETGDKLLTGIAKNLRSCFRNSDTISRYGGDEFVIIIEDIEDQEHLEKLLNTIEFAISEPIVIDRNLILTANASVGMAIYPDDASEPEALIKIADSSMYIQKKPKEKKTRSKSKSKPISGPSVLPLFDELH